MGNSQSNQDKQQIDMVTQYLIKQQEMIKIQQQQIQDMMKQQQQQQQQQQPQQQQQSQPNNYKQLPPISPIKNKRKKTQIDPYKVLGLNKNAPLNEKILKKAYIKKARKYHPDKGGDKTIFQMISIAYTVLKKKLQDSKQDLSHQELRSGYKQYIDTRQEKINPNLSGTDFDINLFNKIFDDNKIIEPTDKGYSQWMKENNVDEEKKMFNGKFNKAMFDSVFAEEKRKQEIKYGNSQIVKYEGPQAIVSLESQTTEIGQGDIEDFSGNTNHLQYRDYKDAYTRSCLISEESVDPRQEYQSIQHFQQDRSNISYTLSPEEARRQEFLDKKRKKQEHRRREMAKQRDLSYEQQYNKINSLLLK